MSNAEEGASAPTPQSLLRSGPQQSRRLESLFNPKSLGHGHGEDMLPQLWMIQIYIK